MTSLDLQNSLSQNKSSKLYSARLQQLRDSIVTAKQKTKTETKSQLPYINVSENSHKKDQKLLSYTNRHLRYLYHEFCKQSYIGGTNATFDHIAQSAEVMTLNKWMVFCKQFQLTSKLSNRQIMQIFKIVTQQRTHMNVIQFCRALQVVQQKSKINPQQFATEVLHVDSHAAARKRMCVMKINFSGPKTNFFIQSQLTQNERKQQKKEFKQYKQKQRQYILHQGMFKQQIEHLLSERKSERNRRWEQLKNRSFVQKSKRENQQKQLQKIKKQQLVNIVPAHQTKSKSVFGNYSKIFQTKRVSKTNSTRNTQNNDANRIDKKEQDQQLMQSQSKSRLKFEQKKYNSRCELRNQALQGIQQNLSIIQNSLFNFEVDSDAQSDIILKNHYENEKKLKQIKLKESKLQLEQKIQPENNQVDDDLMITRYN